MRNLTLKDAQRLHPWNTLSGGYGAVPYSAGVRTAEFMPDGVPHIQGSHAVMHAAKSVGKLAAVFEKLDHMPANCSDGMPEHLLEIASMSADLVTVALRLAYLYGFDLDKVLEDRVREKNGVGFEP